MGLSEGDMRAYLCTWNPKRFAWDDLPKQVAKLRKRGSVVDTWSVGSSHRVQKGDRIFMLRQGPEKPGIVGSGHAISDVWEGDHWSDEAKTANYVHIQFDTLLDPAKDAILPRQLLKEVLPEVHWDTQMSGISVPDQALPRLEDLWRQLQLQSSTNTSGTANPQPLAQRALRSKLFRPPTGTKCFYSIDGTAEKVAVDVLLLGEQEVLAYRDANGRIHPLSITEIYDDTEDRLEACCEDCGAFVLEIIRP